MAQEGWDIWRGLIELVVIEAVFQIVGAVQGDGLLGLDQARAVQQAFKNPVVFIRGLFRVVLKLPGSNLREVPIEARLINLP